MIIMKNYQNFKILFIILLISINFNDSVSSSNPINNIQGSSQLLNNECNIVNDEYCIYKPYQDDCAATIIYPYTCANHPDEKSCDFFLDWNINKQDFVKFTLSKYNYKQNQWFALIFSHTNTSNSEIESDILISILPSNNQAKIVSGVIKGSDVILSDEIDSETNQASEIEKKIFSEKINLNINYFDTEFSVKLDSNNAFKLSQCNSGSNDGFYIFYMIGSLDEKNNILFETASVPRSLGPFCLNSCKRRSASILEKSLNLNYNHDYRENIYKHLKLENEQTTIDASSSTTTTSTTSSSSTTINSSKSTETTSILSTSTTTSTTTASTTTTEKSTTTTSFTTSLSSTITTSTTTSTTSSTNIFTTSQNSSPTEVTFSNNKATNTTINTSSTTSTTDTTTTTSTTSATNTTTTGNTVTTTSTSTTTHTSISSIDSTFTINSTSKSTDESKTSTTSQTSLSSIESTLLYSTSTTTKSDDYCPSIILPFKNQQNWTLETIYEKKADRINYVITLNHSKRTERIGLYVNNLVNNTQTFLMIAEVNDPEGKYIANVSSIESKEIQALVKFSLSNLMTTINLSIPRNLKLTNQVDMRDCINLSLYFSDLIQYSAEEFITRPNATAKFFSTLNSVCVNTCGFAPQTPVEFYLSFKMKSRKFVDDFKDLNSNISLTLKNEIQSVFSSALNNKNLKFNNFEILKIKSLSSFNVKKRFVRQSSIDGIQLETKLGVSGENSETQTKKIASNILKNDIATSSINIQDLSIIDSLTIDPDSDSSNQTSTFRPRDTEYPKILALSLTFSLLATITILGGALYIYHRWRTSKSNPNSSSRSIRFAIPNRRPKFEGHMVRLDGITENYTNDDFELQFNNPNFNENELENGQYYTDFTGSREVGIDVGNDQPMDDYFNQKNIYIASSDEKNSDGINNLRIIVKESISVETRQIKQTIKHQETEPVLKNDALQSNGLFRSNNYENLNVQNDDDDINFEYFNEYKQKMANSVITNVSQVNNNESSSNTEKNDDFVNSDNIDLSLKEENDEITDIFSKDIEEVLPELFEDFNKNDNLNSEQSKIKNEKSNSSPALRVTAPLGFSSKNKQNEPDSSDQSTIETNEIVKNNLLNKSNESLSIASEDNDDDFTPIDKNAFKNFRIESNNNFILDESKASLKDLIKSKNSSSGSISKIEINTQDLLKNDNKISLNNENKEVLIKDSNLFQVKKDVDFIFSNEFASQRSCKLKVDKNYSGLGIHLCDNKNHMVKDIEPESPADLGGLKPGDKILSINNDNVENFSYFEVVNKLKEALTNSGNNDEINLVVMNAIEYNLFKGRNSSSSSNTDIKKNDTYIDQFILDEKRNDDFNSDPFLKDSLNDFNELNKKSQSSKSIYDFEFKPEKQTTEPFEFNPFEDINNEMFTPFLHYSSIPPPETFQAMDPKPFDQFDNQIRDDSLEDSCSDTLSSSDTNIKKDINNSFNANEFDFNFNLNMNNIETKNENPSIDFLNDTKDFKTQSIWNSTTQPEYSDIINENNKNINSNKSTPQLRKRF